MWDNLVTRRANSSEIAEHLSELVIAKAAILVLIVVSEKILFGVAAIVTVLSIDSSEFICANVLTVIDIVLVEDCVWIWDLFFDTGFTFIETLDSFTPQAIELRVEGEQVIVILVVLRKDFTHGLSAVLAVKVVDDCEL